MSTYSVLPDTLDFFFVSGDEVSVLLEFDQNLTGYTFTTGVYEVVRTENGATVETAAFVKNFAITPIDLSVGSLNLSLTETDTAAFDPAVTYRWFLRWVAPGVVTRTVISGSINVRLP